MKKLLISDEFKGNFKFLQYFMKNKSKPLFFLRKLLRKTHKI